MKKNVLTYLVLDFPFVTFNSFCGFNYERNNLVAGNKRKMSA